MALSVTHLKISAIPDDPEASSRGEVLPSDWNEEHAIGGVLDQAQNNVAVDGVTITGDGTPGNPLVSTATGSAAWGTITGTISDQTDLQAALDQKYTEGGALNITATSATAFAVGKTGATNPTLQVDSSNAIENGILITSDAGGFGPSVRAISSTGSSHLLLASQNGGILHLHGGSIEFRNGSLNFQVNGAGDITIGQWNATAIPVGKGGVPAAGTTAQVLAKNSNTDYDTEWVDAPAQNLFIQDTDPAIAGAYLWIDTTGGNLNFWVEDGI